MGFSLTLFAYFNQDRQNQLVLQSFSCRRREWLFGQRGKTVIWNLKQKTPSGTFTTIDDNHVTFTRDTREPLARSMNLCQCMNEKISISSGRDLYNWSDLNKSPHKFISISAFPGISKFQTCFRWYLSGVWMFGELERLKEIATVLSRYWELHFVFNQIPGAFKCKNRSDCNVSWFSRDYLSQKLLQLVRREKSDNRAKIFTKDSFFCPFDWMIIDRATSKSRLPYIQSMQYFDARSISTHKSSYSQKNWFEIRHFGLFWGWKLDFHEIFVSWQKVSHIIEIFTKH